MNILFVCLGNICRSPMAEHLMIDVCKKHNIKNIEVNSAGLHDEHEGEQAHFGTQNTLRRHNIQYNKKFKSKPITQELFDKADCIFVMDDQNLKLINSFFDCKDKYVKKITYFGTKGYEYVPDPWYTNNFEQVYDILIDAITNFLKLQNLLV